MDVIGSKSGLKLVFNVNIVYGNLRSDNSQDYAQKPQQNCTFMNSAAAHALLAILVLIQRNCKVKIHPTVRGQAGYSHLFAIFFAEIIIVGEIYS